MEIYPYTDYIYESILQLKMIAADITSKLEEADRLVELSGSQTHASIREFEEKLSKLKDARDSFEDIHDLEMPAEWISEESWLIYELSQWRKKKVKITKEEDAVKEATELNKELHHIQI